MGGDNSFVVWESRASHGMALLKKQLMTCFTGGHICAFIFFLVKWLN
jgi:hypothetical protein